MNDYGWDAGEPEPPEPCQYCSVMSGALKQCDQSCSTLTRERWIELVQAEDLCMHAIQDTERMRTHCARVAGHDGGHVESIPMGMTAGEWEKHVRSYR